MFGRPRAAALSQGGAAICPPSPPVQIKEGEKCRCTQKNYNCFCPGTQVIYKVFEDYLQLKRFLNRMVTLFQGEGTLTAKAAGHITRVISFCSLHSFNNIRPPSMGIPFKNRPFSRASPLRTVILNTHPPCVKVALKPGQKEGIWGSTVRYPYFTAIPHRFSTATRKYQPAAPVYHDHPPLPVCPEL